MSLAKLQALLNVCKGGERIDLTGFTMEKGSFTVPQTLTNPITLLGGVFNGLSCKGLHDVVFDGFEFVVENINKAFLYRFDNVRNLTFINGTVHGMENIPVPSLVGTALHIDNGTKINVRNTHFAHLAYALSFYRNCKNVSIVDNQFDNLSVDAIRSSGGDTFLISGNLFHDFFVQASGNHPDAIQFWTDKATPKLSPRNIVIEKNRGWRGMGTQFQGVFIKDERFAGCDLPKNIAVIGNDFAGTMYHGILVAATDGIVTNNVVMGVGSGVEKSWIDARSLQSGEVKNNYAAYIFVKGALDPSNTILPPAKNLTEAMACMLLNDGTLPPSIPPEQTPTDPPVVPDPPLPAPDPDPVDPAPTGPQPAPEQPPKPEESIPEEAVLVPRALLVELQTKLNELLSK